VRRRERRGKRNASQPALSPPRTSPSPLSLSLSLTHTPSSQAGGAMEAFMIKTGFYDK